MFTFQYVLRNLFYFSSDQLLKKPDRVEEADAEKHKEKAKKPEKPNKEERPMGNHEYKRRQNIENKEDRGRKLVASVVFFYQTCHSL